MAGLSKFNFIFSPPSRVSVNHNNPLVHTLVRFPPNENNKNDRTRATLSGRVREGEREGELRSNWRWRRRRKDVRVSVTECDREALFDNMAYTKRRKGEKGMCGHETYLPTLPLRQLCCSDLPPNWGIDAHFTFHPPSVLLKLRSTRMARMYRIFANTTFSKADRGQKCLVLKRRCTTPHTHRQPQNNNRSAPFWSALFFLYWTAIMHDRKADWSRVIHSTFKDTSKKRRNWLSDKGGCQK